MTKTRSLKISKRKKRPEGPKGPKTASTHKTQWSPSKSACRARTLHTCSSHKRFLKNNFKRTSLVRTRVQSVGFLMQYFEFRTGFADVFESTTKPQREAQNDQSDRTISTLSRCLQWFSKSAHKKYYKTADFWDRGVRGPIRSRKTEVWRAQGRQTAARTRFWAENASNASRVGGDAINIEKRSVWATWAPSGPERKTALRSQGSLTQRGSDDG